MVISAEELNMLKYLRQIKLISLNEYEFILKIYKTTTISKIAMNDRVNISRKNIDKFIKTKL